MLGLPNQVWQLVHPMQLGLQTCNTMGQSAGYLMNIDGTEPPRREALSVIKQLLTNVSKLARQLAASAALHTTRDVFALS